MFPLGILINSASIALGGIIGTLAGNRLSSHFKDNLSSLFGVCALAMGINALGNMQNMPAVIFSVIIGAAIGLALHLGDKLNSAAAGIQRLLSKLPGMSAASDRPEDLQLFVTIIVLFCASSTGIYGSIDAAMTGNHSVLISKSILDFFTALIFACTLGFSVSVVAVPQLVVFLAIFYTAGWIYPLTTPVMIGDFKAVGGVLLLATSFRMLKLKDLPVADMIPGMIVAMPFSWIWVTWILPLL